MQERGEAVLLPDNPAPHITDWLLEIGPTMPAGMGEGPISWEAMDAWCNRTGIDLDPWEARTIRRLSQAYLAERYEAGKPSRQPPYSGVVIEAEQQSQVDRQFKAMLLGFAKPADSPKPKR